MSDEIANRYAEIMNEIADRTNGSFENMTFEDKLTTTYIMKQIDKQMTRYFENEYKIVKAWANLDVTDIILSEKDAQLNRLDLDKNEIKDNVSFFKII